MENASTYPVTTTNDGRGAVKPRANRRARVPTTSEAMAMVRYTYGNT
jgi:hypothetical protein